MKYLKLLRVKHYIKNFLIFLPLFFSKNISIKNLIIVSLGFVIFSLSSSIIYIINDIMDIEKDRNHPTKKNRPLASGAISKRKAIAVLGIIGLINAALFILIYLKLNISLISIITYVLLYIIINFAYSFGLKNIPLVDIFILALGFLLRVLYGGALIRVKVSEWLFLTTLLMAFYLGLGKRRNEMLINTDETKETRKVLAFYTKDFLDKNMYVCLGITIVFYSLWCKDMGESSYLIWTIPIVLLICMKYSLNLELNKNGGDPVEVLLNDKLLILLVMIYIMMLFTILYFIGA